MRKIIIAIAIALITGCAFNLKDMGNTPSKKVEAYLQKYQTVDDDILNDLNFVIEKDGELNNNQRKKYKELMKDNFSKLTYHIKDETVDGNVAVVEVEIEVFDFASTLRETEKYKNENKNDFVLDDGTNDFTKYIDYELNMLEKQDNRIKYTLEFSLHKNSENVWEIDELTEADEEKIMGIYEF